MTTVSEARVLAYQRFLAGFSSAVVVLENTTQKENEAAAGTESWTRISFRTRSRRQETMGGVGNRRFRHRAAIMIQVYTLSGNGLGLSDSVALAAADVFDAVTFSGIDCQAAEFRQTGVDGKWYQQLVEVICEFDEIK